jgi:hypothetical protein
MSLIEEINEYIAKGDMDFLWLSKYEKVEDEIVEEGRWANRRRTVLRNRHGDFVAVEHDEGATEYQDDIEPEAEAYEVYPKQVVKIVYVKAGGGYR